MKAGGALKVGTLKLIVKQVEINRSLTHGTLSVETIRSGSKRDNLVEVAWQRTLQLELVEPLLIQYCRKIGYNWVSSMQRTGDQSDGVLNI
jgi:hypothetical protein